MWRKNPIDGVSACSECGGMDGPFWVARRKTPTDEAGVAGRISRQRHVCVACMQVAVAEPESPWAGIFAEVEALQRRVAAQEVQITAYRGLDAELDVYRPVVRAVLVAAAEVPGFGVTVAEETPA